MIGLEGLISRLKGSCLKSIEITRAKIKCNF